MQRQFICLLVHKYLLYWYSIRTPCPEHAAERVLEHTSAYVSIRTSAYARMLYLAQSMQLSGCWNMPSESRRTSKGLACTRQHMSGYVSIR